MFIYLALDRGRHRFPYTCEIFEAALRSAPSIVNDILCRTLSIFLCHELGHEYIKSYGHNFLSIRFYESWEPAVIYLLKHTDRSLLPAVHQEGRRRQYRDGMYSIIRVETRLNGRAATFNTPRALAPVNVAEGQTSCR
jgi:hypothetical protein